MRIKRKSARKRGGSDNFLDGQMLIASPGMQDERFARTLIYICAHSSEGAMGIVVNQPAADVSFSELLVKLEVISAADKIELPTKAPDVTVVKGGPVETERGFVLHSADFVIEESTVTLTEGVCLTATLDILKAIARGAGPANAILALGYAGWSPGQLEEEIQHNGWLNCDADPDLIFGADIGHKYDRAMHKLGIRPGMLSSEAGHA